MLTRIIQEIHRKHARVIVKEEKEQENERRKKGGWKTGYDDAVADIMSVVQDAFKE